MYLIMNKNKTLYLSEMALSRREWSLSGFMLLQTD